MVGEKSFNQDEFDEFVLDHGVLGFFEEPRKLKSGRHSHWYVNWRKVGDVWGLHELAKYVVNFTKDLGLEPDCFYGVAEGATKLAIFAQNQLAQTSENYGPGSHLVTMGRGKPKEHGAPEDRYFITKPGGRTVVLEDVTTTGGSLLTQLAPLQELKDAEIVAAIGLTNRMELRDDGLSVEQKVNELGISYAALSTGPALLKKAYDRLKPGEEIGRFIEDEFKDHGVEPLSLVEW
jgi:orotate phosphoribosyltransferase